MTAVWVALIVAVSSMCTPLLLAYITGRQRQQEKAEDYKRQDLVSDRLLAAQEAGIRRTDEVARLAAVSAAATDSQLKQIHTLVNSDMTAARQAELDQTKVTLIMVRRVVALGQTAGVKPTADDLAAIETTEARINELQTIVAERIAQQEVMEAETAAAKAEAER